MSDVSLVNRRSIEGRQWASVEGIVRSVGREKGRLAVEVG